MNDAAFTLVTLGGLLVAGLLADALGRRTPLPRVSILLLLGLLAGPSCLDLLPAGRDRWLPLVASMTLVMVGFLLGIKLGSRGVAARGRAVIVISIAVVVVTAAVVFAGLLLLGAPVELALLLGAVSAATAPAATTDVVHELGAQGPFTDTLLGVVAVDDAWGLILFSMVLGVLDSLAGTGSGALLGGARELGGAALIGTGLGALLALVDKHVRPGETTLVEALAGICLCGGLAEWTGTSSLLAAMIMGFVLVRLAGRREHVSHAIESIEWPFLVLFFMLAGASLEVASLPDIGLLGGGYVALRIVGRLLGGWTGGSLAHADVATRRDIGPALLPQAGVALGMALVATQRVPEHRTTLLSIVVASTVLFELLGPVATRRALLRSGECPTRGAPDTATAD